MGGGIYKMIIEALLNIIMTLLQVVFGWINIPGFPAELTNSISSFLSLIFEFKIIFIKYYKKLLTK